MTGQTNTAAERSAHVTRGGPAQSGDELHPVVEWKNERGQTVAAARGVAELRARVQELEAALRAIGYCQPDGQAGPDLKGCIAIARAALTPRAAGADAAPAGWDTGENVR